MSGVVIAPRLSTRLIRAVVRLIAGQVDREELDRVVGSTNSPDIVLQLRRKGVGILCHLVDARDRDGRPCRYGRYELTPAGRMLLQQWGWSA